MRIVFGCFGVIFDSFSNRFEPFSHRFARFWHRFFCFFGVVVVATSFSSSLPPSLSSRRVVVDVDVDDVVALSPDLFSGIYVETSLVLKGLVLLAHDPHFVSFVLFRLFRFCFAFFSLKKRILKNNEKKNWKIVLLFIMKWRIHGGATVAPVVSDVELDLFIEEPWTSKIKNIQQQIKNLTFSR